jgi:hypothetical protein
MKRDVMLPQSNRVFQIFLQYLNSKVQVSSFKTLEMKAAQLYGVGFGGHFFANN